MLDEKPVAAFGKNTSARCIATIKHDDLVAILHEAMSGSKPGDAATNDDDGGMRGM